MRRNLDAVLDLIDYWRYDDAIAVLNRIASPTLEATILRLLCDVERHRAGEVVDRIKPLVERHLTTRERVLVLFVLGRATYVVGEPEDVLHLREAVRLAHLANDPKLLARAQLRLTRYVFHRMGSEAAMPELALLRRLAHAASDMHGVAGFHCLAAELEMKRGKYGAAAKHLRIARALAADTPDIGIKASVDRLSANAALLASEPHIGLPAARRAVQMSEASGAVFGLAAALTTLADLDLLVGNTSEAESVLMRAMSLHTGRSGKLACLDSLIKVDLARSDCVSAGTRVTEINALGAFNPEHYYWLWHIPTRAQYLIASGQAAESVDLLHRYRSFVATVPDHRLLASYVLTDVEAAVATGDIDLAARLLADAALLLPTITLENLVRMNELAVHIAPARKQQFSERADRLSSVGLRGEGSYRIGAPESDASGVLLESATLLGVRGIELVAHEVAALIAGAGCADDVAVRRASPGESSPNANLETLASVGDDEMGRFVILGRPKAHPEAQLSLVGVRLLARAATELASSRQRERQESSLWPEAVSEKTFGMVVASSGMTELVEITRRVAHSTATVLISGESGTGKDLLARAVHDASPRAAKPFVPFNCSALTREMLDSQLFGYRRGAFTGAHEHFPGVIRAAAGGTLFLDEIGELPLDLQPKLLRFLESGEVQPLGEPRPVTVDVRIVAATNAPLEQMVADGRFREDLFYRLNVVRLQVPPLRERREEIPLLVHHFLDRFAHESQKSGLRVAEETMEYLVLFRWPGNVRQLANEMRRLVALAESGAVLMPEHLSQEIAASRRTIPAAERPAAPTEFVVRMDQPLSAATQHLERAMVQYALAAAGNRLEDAARMLGLSRKGLYLKRQRLKIDTTPAPDDADDAAGDPDGQDAPGPASTSRH